MLKEEPAETAAPRLDPTEPLVPRPDPEEKPDPESIALPLELPYAQGRTTGRAPPSVPNGTDNDSPPPYWLL